mgnify:CR=1 FL=1
MSKKKLLKKTYWKCLSPERIRDFSMIVLITIIVYLSWGVFANG